MNEPRGERIEIGLAYHYRDEVPKVLAQWVEELTPGSTLNLIVPDFAFVAQNYRPGMIEPFHELVVGGANEAVLQYRCAFDERTLAEFMRQAGLIDVRHYDRKPGYLHMAGDKPESPIPVIGDLTIHAVISQPRLGFTAFWMAITEALLPLRIPLMEGGTAYWEQGMQVVIERALSTATTPPDAVLTLDHDTPPQATDILALKRILMEHPEVDAIVPLQASRHRKSSLFAMDLPTGVESLDAVPESYFKHPLARIVRGHFGCTLIRRRVFEVLPKPWFPGRTDAQGSYGPGKVDPDCGFWDQFIKAGLQLRLATRVRVPHLVLMMAWPDKKFEPVYQTIEDYRTNGRPNVG